MLPTIRIGSAEFTRLIIGGNPFSGTSHLSAAMDAEMEEYYTMPRIQEVLFDCVSKGINTVQLRADKHIVRALLEFRTNGGKLNWIAQSAPEFGSLENNMRLAAKIGPQAVYYHGSTVDNLYKDGEIELIKQGLKTLRMLGVPVGLCSHMPEVIMRADREEWGADFYMTCLYNLMKVVHISSSLTGKFNQDEPFDEEDRPLMLAAVRTVTKPCLAFKLLGATRRCGTDADVEAAFAEAYGGIKDTDACIVGVFPKHKPDQVAQNVGIVEKILRGKN